jgi:DNA-binding NtrC family response regulator
MHENLSILIVDDDADFLKVYSDIVFSGTTQKIVTCTCALDAIRLIKTGRFDIVLCDYEMPGVSGIELLKATYRCKIRVPFIFITGSVRFQDFLEELEGCTHHGFIHKKDLTKTLVLSKIDTALKQSENERNREISQIKKIKKKVSSQMTAFLSEIDPALILGSSSGSDPDSEPTE